MSSTASVYVPLTSPGHFRLITILPGAYEARLQCTVSEHLIGESPPYECLSYAWGSPDLLDSPSIRVDGNPFLISRELDLALRRMRRQPDTDLAADQGHAGHPRMWTHALCINQTDTLERNAQVARMMDIYRGAACVVAWIGESSDDSKAGLKFMKRIALSDCTQKELSTDGTDEDLDVHEMEDSAAERGEMLESRNEQSEESSDETSSMNSSATEGEVGDASVVKSRLSSPAQEERDELESDGVIAWIWASIRAVPDALCKALCRRWMRVNWETRMKWRWRWRFEKLEDLVAHPTSTWRAAQERKKSRKAAAGARGENHRLLGHHQLTGAPGLCYGFRDIDYDHYFQDKFESSWNALDNLLARP